MTYLFIIIITLLISFIVFEKNFKQLFFSKKKIFSMVTFFSITSIGVFFLYYNLGYPYFSEEKLKKEKANLLQSKELKKNIILQTKNNISSIKTKLLERPNDIGLLLLLASNEAKIGNFDNEITALKKILKIKSIVSVQSLLAQAMLRKNEGLIDLKIKKLVLEIIKKQPNEEGSNYILGLHFKQIGDMDKAIEVWNKTLNNLKANSPWRQILKEELIKIKN
tara:strand:- start:132 stop:797 length:666 start_codon:yes stop_codon:yes gene_type:complete